MRVRAALLLAILAVPAMSLAAPVNYATIVAVQQTWRAQSSGPSDQASLVNSELNLYAGADLSQGALRIRNAGAATDENTGVQAFLYDTLTFAQSAFEGSFGASYDLTVTATYQGTYSTANAFDLAGVGGRIHLYSGATVVDSSVFDTSDNMIDFMFLGGGPAASCAQGVEGPNLNASVGPFSFTVTCQATVTAANPTVRLFMNLPAIFNGGGTWDLNMMNTATLSLGDLGGRTVYSASGVLPGTEAQTAAPVPEPGTLSLLGGALAATAARMRRRSRQARRE